MPTGVLFSLYYGDGDILSLLSAATITILTGLGILVIIGQQPDYDELSKREGYVSVALSWILISAFGALPFVIHGSIPTYTDAFFETISGFTTTGASILTDIEALPHGLLFWRSLTHWLGGMGIIVFSLAILPLLGVGGAQLFIAEVAGPTKDKIHPQVRGTAKRLWAVYVLLTLVNTAALMICGMSLFDALCHAFGTVATGGFSTRNASMAAFSPAAQYVTIVFMFVSGINFSLHYYGIIKGRIGAYFRDEELRFYSVVVLANIVFMGVASLIYVKDQGTEPVLRNAAFAVVSILSTTGFGTADYETFAPYARFVFLVLLFSGSCAGSTSGAIKMVRVLVLVKNGILEFGRLLHPRAVIPVRLNQRLVAPHILHNILAFFTLYMLVFLNGTLVLAILGLDMDSAMGAVASCQGGVGPGIGSVGPVANYAHVVPAGKWVLSIIMLLGRLELFTLLMVFSPYYWRI
ncbi:MAG: TrkH family potassium uptake protein [Spirochaetales bacterium]|nr:TrkH family potassium uptake protein [Spirochaetales bacterium]